MPGADDARLALAEDEVLKVDVGGDLVAGGDQPQLPDDHARLHAHSPFQNSLIPALKIAPVGMRISTSFERKSLSSQYHKNIIEYHKRGTLV